MGQAGEGRQQAVHLWVTTFPHQLIHILALTQQVWNLTNCKLKTNHFGHNGFLNCVTVSPDGSLCASGGKVRQLVPYGWCALIRIDLHPLSRRMAMLCFGT